MSDTNNGAPFHFELQDGLIQLPGPNGERSALVLGHGTMRLKVYAPRGADPQTPHDQDELYFVARGRGYFVHGDERVEFSVGDALFARAGTPHRFESFSNDLVVWVVFYGPAGGER
jgi:mannose-6-phosphate isomerase-like protein (cupin superfamily)